MSREFGSYMGGYFHSQIEYGADDCLNGDDELTRLWGEWLKTFYDIAYAIASSEAGDSGPDRTITVTIRLMPELEKQMRKIDAYIDPFRRVANNAVRQALDDASE